MADPIDPKQMPLLCVALFIGRVLGNSFEIIDQSLVLEVNVVKTPIEIHTTTTSSSSLPDYLGVSVFLSVFHGVCVYALKIS